MLFKTKHDLRNKTRGRALACLHTRRAKWMCYRMGEGKCGSLACLRILSTPCKRAHPSDSLQTREQHTVQMC